MMVIKQKNLAAAGAICLWADGYTITHPNLNTKIQVAHSLTMEWLVRSLAERTSVISTGGGSLMIVTFQGK